MLALEPLSFCNGIVPTEVPVACGSRRCQSIVWLAYNQLTAREMVLKIVGDKPRTVRSTTHIPTQL
jgi:hypothetical protein